MRRFLVLLLPILATSLQAQVKETITVSLVEVPVTVVDRAGNPVRGLTAANFELLDDGKKRELTSFDKLDYSAPAAEQQISPLNPAARRYFMLLFDLSFSSTKSVGKAQDAARDFIARGMGRRDLAAVGTLDVDRGFRLLTAFTTDRALLQAAIADPQTFRATDPLQIAGSPIPEQAQAEFQAVGSDKKGAEQELRDVTKQSGRLDDAYNRARAEKEISMLGGLAKTLRAIPGRKQLILFSDGFDAKLVQGREKINNDMRAENDAVASGELWRVDDDKRFGSAGSLSLLGRMAELFRRSDVVMHAVDIEGVRVQNDTAHGAGGVSNESLFLLSQPTGGDVFRNSNDIKSDLDRLLHQQEVVYLLGFQAPASSPGKPHTLRVKLVNVPGGQAFHRTGYYEAGGEGTIERSLSNAEIILNDIPQRDVRVAMVAAAFPTAGGNPQVPVVVEISGPDLIKNAKNGAVTAEVFLYAFDAEGLVRDRVYQRMSLDLGKLGETLKASGVKYYATMSLPAGAYAVKGLVRLPDADQKGFARADLVVPDAAAVSLMPPLFVDDGPSWVMVKGASHDRTNAGYPFEIDGQTFIPSAAPTKKFAVFAYNIAPGEDAWETAPKSTLLKRVRSSDGTRTKLLFQLDEPAPRVAVTLRKKDSTDSRTASAP